MNEAQTRVGTRVRELRARRGWTQEALGERAGLSYKFIGEIERGVGNPTVASLGQIADAFAIDVGELFRRELLQGTALYPSLNADDVAVVREAKQSLHSLENVMRRLDASSRKKSGKRAKRRRHGS